VNRVVRCIIVRDANRNLVRVLEYRHPVLRFIPMLSQFILDTGESVRPVGGDTFVILDTGEKLTRVNQDQPASRNANLRHSGPDFGKRCEDRRHVRFGWKADTGYDPVLVSKKFRTNQ
jgi:hypothetical protein